MRVCLLICCTAVLLSAADDKGKVKTTGATPQAALARMLVNMHADGLWPHIDRDDDGKLSLAEISTLAPKDPAVPALFAEADQDEDGILAFADIRAAIGQAVALQVIAAPGRSRDRVDAQAVFTRDTAFISDYDIAVDGNGNGTPDPVIKVIRTGTVLGVDDIVIRRK